MTIREVVSRVRTSLKEHTGDTRLTNRQIYAALRSASFVLIKREVTGSGMNQLSNIYRTCCIEMEEVSSIECNIKLNNPCKIFRSKEKIPTMIESSSGSVYKTITTADRSLDFTLVTNYEYNIKSKVRYNITKYVFIEDGYLYSPGSSYPILRITGLFESECISCNTAQIPCKSKLDEIFPCPDYLIEPVVQMALPELLRYKQIQYDEVSNKSEKPTV